MVEQPDIVGRMSVWSLKISEYGITNAPKKAIKGQALADFVEEMTELEGSQT